MNQIFKTALSGEFNHAMRGIGTFYKTVLSEIRVEWNRVKRGVPVTSISNDIRITFTLKTTNFVQI